MDILDIDEVLKDDSFIFLEDKTHDDVSNILQQWKNNNCIPTQHQQQQQQNQEHAFKLNSRTFTRPKRKSAQNLETQFTNTALQNGSQISQQQQHGFPMFNMEIGGLVTTMHKSYLQDTSPPSSICSSMDVSVDRMNNSLITSADFSNLSFLQSTHSMEFGDVKGFDFNLSNKSTSDGYTLSDMIRDRKALESLTMSSDGTLIKDSHIAQIDDISLTFSKTASGSSTMDNSTESMDCNNRTIEVFSKDRTFDDVKVSLDKNAVNENVLHRTMVLNDELISDTTFNLVENSIYGEQVPFNSTELALNVTHNVNNVKQSINETFKKPTMNETVCVVGTANTTFDCQQSTAEPLCETPESIGKNVGAMKIYESTPQTSNVRYNRLQYTPTLKNMTEDLNISPIIGSNDQRNATRVLNETFEREHLKSSNVNSKTFANVLPHFESMEMIENIANPNITFQKSFESDIKSAAGKEMQNVMDLAQAEAELLAGNDEEFDHKLDEFSKIEMNVEQLRMKKSLETIKKRFSCGVVAEKHEQAHAGEGFETQSSNVEQSNATSDNLDKLNEISVNLTKSSILKDSPTNNTKELRNSIFISKELRDSTGSGLSSSTASASSSTGERLLSRRSRLYDDFNFSVLNQSKSPSTSITVPRPETETKIVEENSNESKAEVVLNEKTEENIQDDEKSSLAQDMKCPSYKLTEKRNRDRDRFKTIKIVKPHNLHNENNAIETELNVPCIDDDDDALLETNSDSQNIPIDLKALQNNSRYSRRDKVSPVFNNNNSEIEESVKSNPSKTNSKYLTYKKPKDKPQTNCELPEIYPPNNEESTATSRLKPSRLEPRSLSRPRYISGLQKFSVVSKATSAGDLENTTGALTAQQKPSSTNSNMSRKSALISGIGANNSTQTKTSSDIKSPMGIKSKSFHNLSSNFGYTTTGNGTLAPRSTYGLKKPNNVGTTMENQAKLNSTKSNALTNKATNQVSATKSQKTDDSVFKVPKLVSGIRAPGAVASKRAGLVRPSSGYYSLNVTTKTANQVNEVDADAGRHSPTDSMSSASSRSSAQSGGPTVKPTDINSFQVEEINLPVTVTKLTTDSTGIPKPSRLRPPTNMKRSGLPIPSSIVKR